MWYASIWKSTLTTSEKIVAICIAQHTDAIGGNCYASVTTIAEECSLSRRAVQKAIKVLLNAGLVEQTVRPGTTTVYSLNLSGEGVHTVRPRGAHSSPRTQFTCEPDAPGGAHTVRGGCERGAHDPLPYPPTDPPEEEEQCGGGEKFDAVEGVIEGPPPRGKLVVEEEGEDVPLTEVVARRIAQVFTKNGHTVEWMQCTFAASKQLEREGFDWEGFTESKISEMSVGGCNARAILRALSSAKDITDHHLKTVVSATQSRKKFDREAWNAVPDTDDEDLPWLR